MVAEAYPCDPYKMFEADGWWESVSRVVEEYRNA